MNRSLMTPLLISVQGYAFRGRPMSLLVACAFPAGVFALPSNQQLEVTKLSKPTFPLPIKNSDRFIVQASLQLTYFCPSLFL